MNLQLRKDKVFEVKRGLIPTIKSALFGADTLNAQQLFVQELMESQISQNTFQFLTGSHSFNRRTLDYLIEYGYVQNPIVFGIINSILYKHEDLIFEPYWKGKPYKSKTFDIDTGRAYFNLLTTGTCVYWNRETIGFGKKWEVIDSVNLQESYWMGKFKYKYLEKGVWYNIEEEDLIFKTFLDNPCKANGLTKFGLSPLQAALMPVEALREMYTADTSLLKNKGNELLISAGDANMPLVGEENKAFDETFNLRIRGARNFGKVATTSQKVEVHQLGRTIKELALWDGYKVKTRDICVALNYPSTLAGDTDASTLANYEQSLKSAYTGCVIPIARMLFGGQEMIDALGFEVFINTSQVECLQEDQLKRAEKAKTNQAAIIELNTKVKDGTISKEIAINILVVEWGYDEQEAIKMIMQEQSEQPTINENSIENQVVL